MSKHFRASRPAGHARMRRKSLSLAAISQFCSLLLLVAAVAVISPLGVRVENTSNEGVAEGSPPVEGSPGWDCDTMGNHECGPAPVGSIGVGENVFWKGDYAETAGECDPKDPAQECPTFRYELTTAGGASRLRIGFDLVLDYRRDGTIHPDADDGRLFKIEVFDKSDPANREFTVQTNTQNNQGYSVETFLCFGEKTEGDHRLVFRQAGCPEEIPFTLGGIPCQECVMKDLPYIKHLGGSSAGTWGIRVTALNSSGWSFRMRAGLEGTPEATDQFETLLPNLRPIPPFELSLNLEPLISGGFVGSTPVEGNGCTPDEEASYDLAEGRCLRFSTGPENVGAGDFEVRARRDDALEAPSEALEAPSEFPAHQRIYKANGDLAEERLAGTLVYDPHHGHWHYKDWLKYELFEVTADPPTVPPHMLARFSPGRKAGFCPNVERLADWARFFQDWRGQWERERVVEQANTGDAEGPGCLSPDQPMMGLDAGWGDEYEWGRVDQFVPFPTNGLGTGPKHGSYVLRATTDFEGHVLESDETDNESFVYFTVDERGKITIKQRGYGADPWGPKKVE